MQEFLFDKDELRALIDAATDCNRIAITVSLTNGNGTEPVSTAKITAKAVKFESPVKRSIAPEVMQTMSATEALKINKSEIIGCPNPPGC